MKRLLVICIIALISGNTATLIALTTNLSPDLLRGILVVSVSVTLLSICGIVWVGYYTKKR